MSTSKLSRFLAISVLATGFLSPSFANEFALTHELNINAEMEEIQKQMKAELHAEVQKNLKESIQKNNPLNKMIRPADVKSISYLLASDKGYGRSSFGHAYLRISMKEELAQDDITLEFVADVEDKDLDYLKAMGLGENYGIRVVKSDYKTTKKIHVMQEDRDLTSYVLDINEDQKNKMMSKINGLLVLGTQKKYSFFITNCADIVTDVLNTGLKKPIKGVSSIIPNKIPGILEELDLVKDQYNDDGKTKLRIAKVDEMFPKFLIGSKEIEVQNLKELLSSPSLNDRVYGYYRAHLIREEQNLMDGIRITALVTSMFEFESPIVKAQLVDLFATKKLKVEEFSKIKFKFASRKKMRVKSTRFKTRGSKVYIETVISEFGEKKKYRFELEGFKFKQNKIIDKSGKVISYRVSKHLDKSGFFHPSTLIRTKIVRQKGRNYLTSLLITEKDFFRTKVTSKFDSEDELAYKNTNITTSGFGMCNAHSELSKLLEIRTIYLPEESPLSTEENLELVEAVYNGKIIVVPGYKNAKEFTGSIPMEKLGVVMAKRQNSAYNFYEAMGDWFDETYIDEDNVYNIRNLLDMGVNPIITFRVRGSLAHSALITSMYEEKDHYVFNVIDPNMTYQENLYKLDKRTGKLNTAFYGEVDLRLPAINLSQELGISTLLMMKKTRDLAIRSAKELDNYALEPSDFFR